MDNKARQAALEVLLRCRKDGAWSAPAMDGAIKKTGWIGATRRSPAGWR